MYVSFLLTLITFYNHNEIAKGECFEILITSFQKIYVYFFAESNFWVCVLSIYIKLRDDILDDNVMKIVNIQEVFGMPFGSTVQSIVFSLIGVFVLEFVTGTFGTYGTLRKQKQFLVLVSHMNLKLPRSKMISFICH